MLNEKARTAAILALARHGIEPDVQELLVAGNPMRGIPPGAFDAAITAYLASVQGEPVAWGEFYDGKLATCRPDRSTHCTNPLFAHPADRDGVEARKETHKHLKSGHIVREIGRGFAQVSVHPIEEMTAVSIYEHDGRLWVRNAVEFDDGRFEPLPTPPASALKGGA